MKLYNSKAVRETMSRRDQFWILDSSDYYFEHLERILEPDFVPNEEDCVMARVRTTGIVTTEFDQPNQESKNEWDKSIHWRVIDVGGQRNERKKWIHFFDGKNGDGDGDGDGNGNGDGDGDGDGDADGDGDGDGDGVR